MMAGKISDLATITGAQVALTDDVETRDISDTSMAPTGTNKRMTWQEIINFLNTNLLSTHVNDPLDAHMAESLGWVPPDDPILPGAVNVQLALEQIALMASNGLEVFIGPSDPGVDSGYEIWFDEDAAGPSGIIETAADGALQLATLTAPITAPVSPKWKLVNVKIGNAGLPMIIMPSGRPMIVDPGGWLHGQFNPNYQSTTVSTDGMGTVSATGTATSATITNTTPFTRARRVEYLVSTPSATAVAGYRTGIVAMMGDGTGMGGFLSSQRWGPATGVTGISTHRAFCGMTFDTAAPTDVEPSSLILMFGMGWDSADTNVQMMSNDSTGSATKVDLGASWPVPTTDRTAFYELILYQPHGVLNEINYMVVNLVTGATVNGVWTTDIPPPDALGSNTPMVNRAYCSVGGTSSVVGLAHFGLDTWVCL